MSIFSNWRHINNIHPYLFYLGIFLTLLQLIPRCFYFLKLLYHHMRYQFKGLRGCNSLRYYQFDQIDFTPQMNFILRFMIPNFPFILLLN